MVRIFRLTLNNFNVTICEFNDFYHISYFLIYLPQKLLEDILL
jgi:hypothetical protein